MNPLYSLKNITLKYPLAETRAENEFVTALDNLSLDIYENEYLAILGGNGSGKSSLAKLLAGLSDCFNGEIRYRGEAVMKYDRDYFADVAMILQEPQNQILMPTVRDEIAFPLENRKLSPDLIMSKTENIAAQFHLEKLLDKKTEELSGGQITSLAMATALVVDPKILILDEPDSHLDKDSRLMLQGYINNHKAKITIILITQFPETAGNADRCLVLENGRLLYLGLTRGFFENESLKEETKLFPKFPNPDVTIDYQESLTNSKSKPILKLKNVCYSYDKHNPVLNHINLDIYPGSKVGLFGPSGAGKSTLGLLMAGLLKSESGEILLNNTPFQQIPSRELRKTIAYSMQFPERALIGHTVAEDIAFGPENLGHDDIARRVEENIQNYNLNELENRHPFTLSGGQKRKVALAGIMAINSPIVILDEPTAALDPRSAAEFVRWLINDKSHTFIIISHDRRLLDLTCTNLIHLQSGRIAKSAINKGVREND